MAAKEVTLDRLTKRRKEISDFPEFEPALVNRSYLEALGVSVVPTEETVDALIRGSRLFMNRLSQGTLLPRPRVMTKLAPVEGRLEVHNYTGACPTSTYEINPLVGCNVGCLYCLVTDGSHEREMEILEDYPSFLERVLVDKLGERCFFYYSPKTEALQEPTLQTGIAHEILRVFIRHFRDHPESQFRLFVASKAGSQHLNYRNDGESVLDLFARLAGRMQFNTSLSIMPRALQSVLEPNAATMEDRLEAVALCQEAGVLADSALVQPIMLPSIDDEGLEGFFSMLRSAGIRNFKPEFLTVSMENLALIGQIAGYFDKDMERDLYELYISPENANHKKQRDRTAPLRDASRAILGKLVDAGRAQGISTSICYWVRKELSLSESFIPSINRNGYQCLGYQQRLFDNVPSRTESPVHSETDEPPLAEPR